MVEEASALIITCNKLGTYPSLQRSGVASAVRSAGMQGEGGTRAWRSPKRSARSCMLVGGRKA